VNDPRDLPLEDRLRAHYADRARREALPPAGAAPSAPPAPPAPPWWRRPTLLAAAAALVVLAAVAATVALDGDDPEELGTVGEGTSTTAQQESTTTTVAPTTTSSTTTSTSVPPASGVTVVVAPEGILGWWDGSAWVRSDSGAAPPVSGGESYALVQLGADGTAIGSAPGPGCGIGDPGPPIVDLGVDGSPDRLAPVPIGLLGVAEPHPRPVTALGDRAEYVQIAQELAAARGLSADGVTVDVQRADLGGNGTDEVLLRVERISDPQTLFAAEGDFSIVVLRQVIDGQVQTTVLHESVAAPGDDVATPFVEVGRVAAIADLNGEGRMEVVIQRRYYEGSSTQVWESDPSGGVHGILDVGCGA
jgi:hypothetical protein